MENIMAKLIIRTGTKDHKVVSPKEWLRARKKLLVEEKKFTGLHDRLKKRRRELPWTKVAKDYVFDGPDGKETLSELLAGKSQLLIYHFVFAREGGEGCPACWFWADNFAGARFRLAQRDTALAVVSRAPLGKLVRFK